MNIKKSTFLRAMASCSLCSLFLVLAVWTVSGSQKSTGLSQKALGAAEHPSGAGERPSGTCNITPPPDAFQTTKQYVETFYPLWFTNNQAHPSDYNVLIGPERVSPLYHSVVMINDDTVYCSAFLNVNPNDPRGGEPMAILTVPSTGLPGCSDDFSVTYSILILSPYGDVWPSPSPSPTPPSGIRHGAPPIPGGIYAFVGPDYTGVPAVPPGVTPIQVPWNNPTLIFRTDKYHSFASPTASPSYVNQINQAYSFRSSLQLQTLSQYNACQSGDQAVVKPEFPDFSIPYKTIADKLVAEHPIDFLRDLRAAVHSHRTPSDACTQELSNQFDILFGDGHWPDNSPFGQGVQAAHAEIVDNYVNGHQLDGNWTHFTNIGNWEPDNIALSDAIDRSSITEFCQFCNDLSSALYYHAFRDGAGQPLDGHNVYVLTFPAPTPPNQFNYPGPDTTRFWSLTAYTEQSIELVPNEINKYEVASYSGARINPVNGSLSIYMAAEKPDGVPFENWLPVPKNRHFNVVLRDYGPADSVLPPNAPYVPPAIQLQP